MSRTAVEDELRSGQLGEIRLLDGPPKRTWFVVHSAVGPMRQVVRSFLAFVAERRESRHRAS